MITEATPGSDYDEVYRNNFDEDFSITPNKTEMMEKLMNEHHVTLLRTVDGMSKHQLYQSCQVIIVHFGRKILVILITFNTHIQFSLKFTG